MLCLVFKPMSFHRSFLLACVAVCALASNGISPAYAETLEKAVESSLNRHPSVVAALAGRNLAREERQESFSAFFPEVNVTAATGRIYGDNSTSRGLSVERGTGYSWNHEYAVSVNQPIFDGMETIRRVEAADARMESARINIDDVRESLGLRVVLAYIDVLRNREALAMIQGHGKKIADYKKRIKSMVDEGMADESMAVQAEDIQNQLDATIADVEGQLDKSLADYAEAVGHAAEENLVRPVLDDAAMPPDPDQAVQAALRAHPALMALQLQGQATASEIDAERGTIYPDIVGEISHYKKDLADVIGGEVVDNRALLRMNWNFSTGGAQLARIRQSTHRHAEAEARAAEVSARIEREIRKAYAEIEAAQNRRDVGRDRVDVSARLVSAYEKQFEAGKVTLLNILQAENNHFNAKLSLMNADFRVLAARYSVLANMGQLQKVLNIVPVAVEKTAQVRSEMADIKANE